MFIYVTIPINVNTHAVAYFYWQRFPHKFIPQEIVSRSPRNRIPPRIWIKRSLRPSRSCTHPTKCITPGRWSKTRLHPSTSITPRWRSEIRSSRARTNRWRTIRSSGSRPRPWRTARIDSCWTLRDCEIPC
jgi:hypothetical protein